MRPAGIHANTPRQVVTNAKAMAAGLMRRGLVLTTGGTDNHLMVIDLRPTGFAGAPSSRPSTRSA